MYASYLVNVRKNFNISMKDWYACSPVWRYYDENNIFVAPLQLSKRIFIGPRPSILENIYEIESISQDWLSDLEESHVFVYCSYQADSDGDPDPDWNGTEPRSIQDVVSEEIRLVQLAFWLAQPSYFKTRTVMHFRIDSSTGIMRTFQRAPMLRTVDTQKLRALSQDNLNEALKLYQQILLLPRDATIWSSVRMFYKSLTEGSWDIRYLLNWIVLECLFGPQETSESTHKLCERIAFFLGTSVEEAKDLFNSVKKSYGLRSKIVHGSSITKLNGKNQIEMLIQLEEIVRKSLVKIIQDNNYLERFDGDGRDKYLQNLIFEKY